MNFLAKKIDERIANVHISEKFLVVDLMDGRIISVPLTWYPKLHSASAAQRKHWQISGGGYGIHWPEIDEDLSIDGLLHVSATTQKHG